eukprot:1161690-Pelagomonas_calceolata.AAC.7
MARKVQRHVARSSHWGMQIGINRNAKVRLKEGQRFPRHARCINSSSVPHVTQSQPQIPQINRCTSLQGKKGLSQDV